jgi:hypothetical protein
MAAPETPTTTTPTALHNSCTGAQAARGADPWTADQQEWRDAWDVLMARLGWAPKWQRERARELWEAGVR